jgi:hypothetical protein
MRLPYKEHEPGLVVRSYIDLIICEKLYADTIQIMNEARYI